VPKQAAQRYLLSVLSAISVTSRARALCWYLMVAPPGAAFDLTDQVWQSLDEDRRCALIKIGKRERGEHKLRRCSSN
jgi:hypothetical protein